MTGRRSKGDHSIYFEHHGACRDATRHRRCPGRWRGEMTIGYAPSGKRLRRRVSGASKAAVQDALNELQADLKSGITKAAPVGYTVRKAAEDWLTNGLHGRSPKTVRKNQDVLEPVLSVIGGLKLRKLDAAAVDNALKIMADTYSTAAVSMGHLALKRAIRFAAARDLVGRNVAELCDIPAGQLGRPSRSFTLEQSAALVRATGGTRIGAYICLCLATGIRTEEARALTWAEVDLDAGTVAVYRSVRAKGDTKTRKSRRVLKLPERATEALKEHRTRQAAERLRAGGAWQDHGLVFCREDGTPLDRWQVRREFAVITKAAGLGEAWAPRELRHSFVSILSAHGVRIEDISDLMGHSGTTVTETVYRHEIRPALTTGATAMDQILTRKRSPARLPRGEPATLRLTPAQPPATQPATRRATPAKPRPSRRA